MKKKENNMYKIELKKGISKRTGKPYRMLVTYVKVNGREELVVLNVSNGLLGRLIMDDLENKDN